MEQFRGVPVDAENVRELVEAFHLEGGGGPATSLLCGMGLRPGMAKQGE